MPLKILDKELDFSKLDTWNILIGFIGFVITIFTLIVSNNARRAVKRIQNDITFDKRIPEHLTNIDKLLKSFNKLLENIPENRNAINILLSKMVSELNSVNGKIKHKESKRLISQAKNEIERIRKYNNHRIIDLYEILKNIPFVKIERPNIEDITWASYSTINEVYSTITNFQKDKETRLKGND